MPPPHKTHHKTPGHSPTNKCSPHLRSGAPKPNKETPSARPLISPTFEKSHSPISAQKDTPHPTPTPPQTTALPRLVRACLVIHSGLGLYIFWGLGGLYFGFWLVFGVVCCGVVCWGLGFCWEWRRVWGFVGNGDGFGVCGCLDTGNPRWVLVIVGWGLVFERWVVLDGACPRWFASAVQYPVGAGPVAIRPHHTTTMG